MPKQPAVFLDRDGVINKRAPTNDPIPYITTWAQFSFLPGALESIRQLHEGNFLILIVTNQRCVARGMLSEAVLTDLHNKMVSEITRCGGSVDGIYSCLHDILDNCSCRKPKPGLIFLAKDDLAGRGIEIDWQQSFIVGDSKSDIEAGRAAGLKSILIGTSDSEADYIASDLFHATALILEHAK